MKRAYIYAGAASTALFAMATAFAADPLVQMWRSAGESPVEIEEVRERERKRLQKMDEDEDGNVSLDEFAAQLESHEMRMDKFSKLRPGQVMRHFSSGSWADPEIGTVDRRVIVKRLHADAGEAMDIDVEVEETVGDVLEDMDVDVEVDVGMHPFARMFEFRADVADRERDPSRWFDTADANGDGVLDRDEVLGAKDRIREQGVKKRFDGLDNNKDGVLNDEDIDLRLKRLEALDADGDGAISDREVGEVMKMLGNGRKAENEHFFKAHPRNGTR